MDLEVAYDEWREGGLDAIYGRLASRDFLRGRHVAVDGTRGTGEKIDREGRLEIRTPANELVAVESGEVLYDTEREAPPDPQPEPEVEPPLDEGAAEADDEGHQAPPRDE